MSPALLLIAALQVAPTSEVLDFSATWCVPCQNVKPVVEKLRREGHPIRIIDVDRQRDVARHFNINSMPTFVLVVDGKEVQRVEGGQSEESLRAMLAKIPREPLTQTSITVESEPESEGVFDKLLPKRKPKAAPPKIDDRVDRRALVSDPPTGGRVAAPSAAQDPLQTVVRIRVKDERGTDFGSGTVIGSLEGKALVLTCWHIFREFGDSATVEVDLFPQGPDGPVSTFPGRLIKGDQEADVAVVGVAGCGVLPVSPIASADFAPQAGDHVFSVGCGEGKNPTKLQHSVTRLDPYQGPHTTECTGMPVVGRSGGGLFDTKGRVIGVCFAANRAEEKGVYVGLEEIHKLVGSAGYTALIPAPSTTDVADRGAMPGAMSRDTPNFSPEATQHAIRDTAEPQPRAPLEETPATSKSVARSTSETLEIPADMEATVILRPRNQPNAPTKVIVINNVSNRFRRYLTGEVDRTPVETGLRVADVNSGTPSRTARVALLCRVFDNRH